MRASPATTFLEALEEKRGGGRAAIQVEPQTPPGISRVDPLPRNMRNLDSVRAAKCPRVIELTVECDVMLWVNFVSATCDDAIID